MMFHHSRSPISLYSWTVTVVRMGRRLSAVVIFDAYCRLRIMPEEFQAKGDEIKQHTQICDNVLLVMPNAITIDLCAQMQVVNIMFLLFHISKLF